MLGAPKHRYEPTQTNVGVSTIRWFKLIFRHPELVMLDIAYEKPVYRSIGILIGLYLLNVAAILTLRSYGMITITGDTTANHLQSIGFGFIIIFAAIFMYGTITYIFSRILSGTGSYRATLGGATFALMPFSLNATATFLFATPLLLNVANILQFISIMIALAWSAFLYSIALRTNHEFTDIQAMMAMLLPPAILTLAVGVGITVVYLFAILVT
ncbi:MAG: YIP1 family protein [SAR202 cluster bacterium]|nr:YIP1 family protein [SAR202 cluster bacterium]|tara:strand:- start:155 stop:796 length:642 start_codon:yes stop_codon:yes gene_type:complete